MKYIYYFHHFVGLLKLSKSWNFLRLKVHFSLLCSCRVVKLKVDLNVVVFLVVKYQLGEHVSSFFLLILCFLWCSVGCHCYALLSIPDLNLDCSCCSSSALRKLKPPAAVQRYIPVLKPWPSYCPHSSTVKPSPCSRRHTHPNPKQSKIVSKICAYLPLPLLHRAGMRLLR